jgi:PPOX class probable F420-dependent enzyme
MSEGFAVDTSTPFGARAARHLREDVVVWLTTVSPSGAPSPNPVWYLWDGAATVLTWNLPTSARVAHVATNPSVALHFDGDGRGGDIVVVRGTAVIDHARPGPDAVPEYLAKYGEHIARIGHTPASFAAMYSVPVAVRLTGLRGH